MYHFRVTVTLTLISDLVLRITMYRAHLILFEVGISKIVSEYVQEIPQSQTADNPMAPPGRAIHWQPSRDTRKTN